MSKEIWPVNFIQKSMRIPTAAILERTLFRTTLTDNCHSIGLAENVLKSKEGLVIVINHFSRGEPNRAINMVFTNPTMRTKKLVSPIALHMNSPFYHLLGKINGAIFMPIVTESTLKKKKYKNHELNEGLRDYLTTSVNALKAGNIVIVAPQGERMPTLGQPDDPAIGTLMLQAKRKNIDNYSFLFIGYGIKGEKDYSKKRGFNLKNRYNAQVGSCLSNKDILMRAQGSYRAVDQVIYEELRKVVPLEYA